MKSFSYYLKNPKPILLYILTHFLNWLPDEKFLKLRYRIEMGQHLNLSKPETFQEKIQWLKLYNRQQIYTKMVDKYAVKEYVSCIIGDKYITPTLGIWDNPQKIDFNALPNKFVLKTTHGGGGGSVIICKDKSSFDITKAILKLKKCMDFDIFKYYREWPYKNVPKRIIAEEYIENTDNSELLDYKFFCFNGVPKFLR